MPARREGPTLYHRVGFWLTRRVPGVYVLRYVWTPLDRLILRLTGGRTTLAHAACRRCCSRPRAGGRGSDTPPRCSYLEEGGRYIVVASNYGRRRQPAWSYNLMANPKATIQIGRLRREVQS